VLGRTGARVHWSAMPLTLVGTSMLAPGPPMSVFTQPGLTDSTVIPRGPASVTCRLRASTFCEALLAR
jgi:hypothetical protein